MAFANVVIKSRVEEEGKEAQVQSCYVLDEHDDVVLEGSWLCSERVE